MGKHGGAVYARGAQRELQQRRIRQFSYVLLAVLAVATVAVVLMAVGR